MAITKCWCWLAIKAAPWEFRHSVSVVLPRYCSGRRLGSWLGEQGMAVAFASQRVAAELARSLDALWLRSFSQAACGGAPWQISFSWRDWPSAPPWGWRGVLWKGAATGR